MKGNDSLPSLDFSNNANVDNEDEFGDFVYQGESLLTLVKPELISLSQYWLAALKDHALLSLPAEFASQLPHDGGAFYTNDTMESSRPHYSTSWPPILHAAALWLNADGFRNTLTENDNDNAINNNPNSTVSNQFHLLFGICMEALCSTRSSEPLESIITCLKALFTLLESNVSKEFIMADKSLAIELCNVLHRSILTRDNHTLQFLCMEVLKQVITGAQQQLEASKQEKLRELEDADVNDLDMLGEGGDTGDISPENSLVFAVLEVCLCLLVRQLPALSPAPNSIIVNSLRVTQNSDESGRLIASAITTMENLHKLCSPKGAQSVLPTVLYLTTGVIKEMASKSANQVNAANNVAVQAALHCLKTLATDKYSRDERCDVWHKLLQSALAKVIDLAKTGSDDNNKLDDVTMMLAIAVFVLHAPAKVVIAPNLQYPCINHFRQCLQNDNPSVSFY